MNDEGIKWNIFGEAVEGARTGERLQQAKSFIAYWFGWAAFYANSLIFQKKLATQITSVYKVYLSNRTIYLKGSVYIISCN